MKLLQEMARMGRRDMKSGRYPSKMEGSRVRVRWGDHEGKEGTVLYAERVPTFSQRYPWKTEYRVEFDDGTTASLRKESVRKLKDLQNETTT